MICCMLCLFSLNCDALDMLKMEKVAENPKARYVRKMEKAIIVQTTATVPYQYLKRKGYSCCRF